MPPVPVTVADSSANLVECFSSVQGEGVLIGRRQAFLRFPGCNLACSYCDTVHELSDSCDFEMTPGLCDFEKVPNPVPFGKIMGRLSNWKSRWPLLHHSISITGGEPLLHSELLAEWLPELRTVLPIFLETNGLLTSKLVAIIDHIDFISMDIKLPSTSGHEDLWQQHTEFLTIAAHKQCYVKIVAGWETSLDEINVASRLIARIDPDIPLIIQPVTQQLANPGMGAHMLSLQQTASFFLQDVRVIPQTHVLMRVL